MEKYSGLRGMTSLYHAAGIVIAAGAAGALIVITIKTLNTDGAEPSQFPYVLLGKMLGGVLGGLFLYAFGDFLSAVADIAESTAKSARLLEATFGDKKVVVERAEITN